MIEIDARDKILIAAMQEIWERVALLHQNVSLHAATCVNDL